MSDWLARIGGPGSTRLRKMCELRENRAENHVAKNWGKPDDTQLRIRGSRNAWQNRFPVPNPAAFAERGNGLVRGCKTPNRD